MPSEYQPQRTQRKKEPLDMINRIPISTDGFMACGVCDLGLCCKSRRSRRLNNSPPIHRWVWDKAKDLVREADGRTKMRTCIFVQSSASRTPNGPTASPSAKALGYCHSVRFADEEKCSCSKTAIW